MLGGYASFNPGLLRARDRDRVGLTQTVRDVGRNAQSDWGWTANHNRLVQLGTRRHSHMNRVEMSSQTR